VKQGLFSYPYWSQKGDPLGVSESGQDAVVGQAAVSADNLHAYAFPMAVAAENCTNSSCEARSEGDGSSDGSNFLLVNAASAQGQDVRIDPLAADPNLEVYAVEGSWSTNLPAVTAAEVGETGVRYQYTVTVDSTHIVQAYNLALPENVRLRLATTVTVEGLVESNAGAVAHLFPPGNGIYPKSVRHDKTGKFSALSTLIPQGRGGNYGVVLELPGDKTAFDTCGHEGCYVEDEASLDREPKDRTLEIVFTVQVCPVNSIPTDTGCALVMLPNWSNPDLYRVVGPYRVFSPSGFIENVAPCSGTTCSNRYKDGKEYATIITWSDVTTRMAIVAGNDTLGPVIVSMRATPGSEMLLSYGIWALGKADGLGGVMPFFQIKEGFISAGFTGENYGFLDGDFCYFGSCRALVLSEYDIDNYAEREVPGATFPRLRISMAQNTQDTVSQYAEFMTDIVRPLQTVSGIENQLLRVTWSVQAEGYRGWLDSPGGTGPVSLDVNYAGIVLSDAPVAGLTYEFGPLWTGYYAEAEGIISEFRNESGVIVQPANMGGAWNHVDYVVLPFGKSPDGGSGLAQCGSFCGDVRAPDDTWAVPKHQWKMPDILVNQLPNTVMVSSPGNLQVYSTDHPSSIGATNDTYGFSFKTFGANVELVDGVCPDGSSNQPVSLIKGTTSLSMPGLDPKADPGAANSAIPSITASFVLCENSLRQVSLTFRYPPGIPVAAPPVMYVDMIGGTVTIGPEDVVIRIDVGFYVGAGAPKVMKGVATLTLDTRGLFDMQVTARVMGAMDAEGHLWVAWNPLDMGVGVQGWLPNKDDWVISGFVYAHVWRGSGWQNKYPWLAGNDDFHMTASLQATFKIAKGAVIDEWPLVIPPGQISIGVELSFGQFCDNDTCTEQEWGIKGKVTIVGFDVGIYVSLECPPLIAAVVFPPAVLLCSSFILGSDSHLLIDQYGGGGPPFPLIAGAETVPEMSQETATADAPVVRTSALAEANRISVADPTAAQVDQPLTVNPTASSIMVAFGWVRGAPNFALQRPDGQIMTAATAASMGASLTTTANSLIFGIHNPQPGQWIAHITNATPMDDYRLMYFANKATPALAFTAPTGLVNVTASGDSTAAQNYRIQWTPPTNAAQLSMSLFYSATVPNATASTYQYGGVIREGIDPSAGFYDWDVSHLSTGDYRIYATLQDEKGAQVSAFGTDQFVGVTTTIAPGTLHYSDLIAPPVPNAANVSFTQLVDDVLICWDVNPAHDLSEYFVTYEIVDNRYLGFGERVVRERVIASVTSGPGARQCMLISGLTPGDAMITFPAGSGLAARDASGNLSGFAQPSPFTVSTPGSSLIPPSPPVLAGSASGGNANLSWNMGATSYELFYAQESYAGPHQPSSGASQGASPVVVAGGFGGNYTVSGLEPGHWYAFAVRSYSAAPAAQPSLLSNQLWLLISSGADSNGDGCPDDWEAAHAPYIGSANPDGDGFTTAQECKMGTNPNVADTDGDGVVDGGEVQAGTNPLDPASFPSLTPAELDGGVPAILGVEQSRLSFFAFTQGPNPAAQSVPFSNLGDGTFSLSLTDNQGWLVPSVEGSTIAVNINKAGLGRGTYTGTIQVNANPASTLGSPQVIHVTLVMLAGPQPGELLPIYLPKVSR
jgi:hypothetical protein